MAFYVHTPVTLYQCAKSLNRRKIAATACPACFLDVPMMKGEVLSRLGRVACYRTTDDAGCNMLAQLSVTAQNVCKFHVMGRPAFRRKEAGAADNDTSAMSARGCYIEAIEIVEEFHASRRIL